MPISSFSGARVPTSSCRTWLSQGCNDRVCQGLHRRMDDSTRADMGRDLGLQLEVGIAAEDELIGFRGTQAVIWRTSAVRDTVLTELHEGHRVQCLRDEPECNDCPIWRNAPSPKQSDLPCWHSAAISGRSAGSPAVPGFCAGSLVSRSARSSARRLRGTLSCVRRTISSFWRLDEPRCRTRLGLKREATLRDLCTCRWSRWAF